MITISCIACVFFGKLFQYFDWDNGLIVSTPSITVRAKQHSHKAHGFDLCMPQHSLYPSGKICFPRPWILAPRSYTVHEYILITTQQAHQASDDQGDAEVNSKDDIVHKLHAGYNQEALLQVEWQLNLSLHTREQAIR